jgi:putative ABC transport system permease protein
MGLTMLSFIVGIIGIMNIMFVSVSERTREIGIRKAIGAKKSSILTQFIVESASLCFIGAIISFVLCSAIIFLAATLLPKANESLSFLSPVMPFQFLIIGASVSIFVGILAGLIPAFRAASLDPIEALRYE